MVDTFFSTLLDPGLEGRTDDPADDLQTRAERSASFARLLQIIAGCWLVYIGVLYLLDTVSVARTPQLHVLPARYYLLQTCAALIVFGMSASSRAQRHMGRAFLPAVFVCFSVLPLLITALVMPLATGPISGIPGLLNLRFGPVVLIGVLLIAWNYPWKYTVFTQLALFLLLIVPAVLYPQLTTITLIMALLQTLGSLILSYCISVLIERLRQQRVALRHANRQLRHYASTLEHLTISRERNRVARELHDTLAHTLSSLSVQLETVKAYWAINPDVAQELLETALGATRSGLQETRRALDALRARPLDDVGLRIALYEMATAAVELANLQLDLTLPDELPALDPETEQAIYRIAQEAIANVTHHAEAQGLTMAISSTDMQLVMRIQDNGRGFDQSDTQPSGHYGLAGMAERAGLIGGKLVITSAPGAGTLVELTLPIDERGPSACVDL